MKKIARGVILSVLADTAIGTVCPLSVYQTNSDGASFYKNLVVAAVVDWSYAGSSAIDSGKKASPALLANALYVGSYKLTSVSSPVANSWLMANLSNGGSCASCAYNFYVDVIADLFNYHTANSASYAMPRYGCNSGTSSDYATADGYLIWGGEIPVGPNNPAPYTAPINLDFDLTSNLSCVGAIQRAIEKFNACASNGFDIRTGAFSTICTNEDDFFNLDAQFGAYKILMDFALSSDSDVYSMPPKFVDGYTKLPCRSCFDQFVSTVHANRATLGSVGHTTGICVGTTPFMGEYYNVATCLASPGVVSNAVVQFQVCAGTYNALYTIERFPLTSDEGALFNQIFKSYQPVAACSATHDPGMFIGQSSLSFNLGAAVPDPTTWAPCVTTSNGGSSLLTTTPTSQMACFKQFGHAASSSSPPSLTAYTHCAPTGENGPFTADCLTDLNRNTTNSNSTNFIHNTGDSLLMTFYKCSGVKLDTTTSTCSADQIKSIGALSKSYIPILEIALEAGSDYVSAGKQVLANSDIMDVVSNLPCGSCFAKLATELSNEMAHNDITLCENMYSSECKQSTSVVAALASFKSCSGFSLTNVSPNECTDDEWSVLQASHLVHNSFDLVVPNNTQTLLEAHYKYSLLMGSIESANPTMSFKCNHCFEILLTDLYSLSEDSILLCDAEIMTAECFSVAAIPFAKFEDCSGHALEWTDLHATTVAPTEDTTTAAPSDSTTSGTAETTTVAPDTTTVEPETTKATHTALTISLTLAGAVLAVLW